MTWNEILDFEEAGSCEEEAEGAGKLEKAGGEAHGLFLDVVW